MEHYTLRIYGRVQGVWYRAAARDYASALGITGFVCNEPDGSVTIDAEGTQRALDALYAWCQIGSEDAHPERVERTPGPLVGYTSFDIRYD